jgi:hypothetical protein
VTMLPAPALDRGHRRAWGGVYGTPARAYGQFGMTWRGTADEAVVYTAAGMIAGQAECSLEAAVAKLRDRAEAISRTVPDAARLVLAGVIRFDP